MTDGPMGQNAGPGDHPDEGTIHAWLDDALDAASAERVAVHVAACPDCAARVAEARGLIAGASRVIAALDDLPAGARPGWAQGVVDAGAAASTPAGEARTDPSLWKWLRVTPGRAAIAATLLVALGITLTHERVADDSVKPMASISSRATDVAGGDQRPADAGAPSASEAVAERAPDRLLDSAVARNLEITQGKRSVQAAPGPSIPQAPPPSVVAGTVPSTLDGERVALGRQSAQSQRETAGAAADRLRVGGAVGNVEGRAPSVSSKAAIADEGRSEVPYATGARMAQRRVAAVAIACYRIESAEKNARWGDQPLPVIVAVDSGPALGQREAAVLTTAGAPTSARAIWSRSANDSVSIRLRRIGFTGAMALGPDAGGRTGVASSGAATTILEEAVVVSPSARGGAGAVAQSRVDRPAEADQARRAEARKAAPSQPAAAAPAPSPAPPLRLVQVSARAVSCPAR